MESFKVKITSPLGIYWYGQELLADIKRSGEKLDDFRFDFKEKVDGKVKFSGVDFNRFLAIEQSQVRCERVYFTIYENCGGVWEIRDKAYISMRDGDWDLNKCIVSFKVIADEKYGRYDDFKGVEYNLFDITQIRRLAYHPRITGEMSNGVDLYEALRYMYRQAYPYGDLKSNFFNWGTGSATPGDKYILFQKSDIIRRVAASDATIFKMTMDTLVNELCKILNLKYKIDEQTNLCIDDVYNLEDYSHTNDLTGYPRKDFIAGLKQYTYGNEKVYRREVFTMPDSKSLDFVGVPIIYENACTELLPETSDLKIEATLGTDLEALAALDPTADNEYEGGVLVSATYQPGNQKWLVDQMTTTILDPIIRANSVLSWAYLHQNRFKDRGRLYRKGVMNGTLQSFSNIQKTRKQSKLKIKLCCGDNFSVMAKTITNLGVGDISKYSLTYDKYTMEIDVAFETPDLVVVDIPVANDDESHTVINTTLNSLAASLPSLKSNDYEPHFCEVVEEIKKTFNGGVVNIDVNGFYIYSPPTGFVGLDFFDYTLLDTVTGYTNNGNVNVGVRPTVIYVKWEVIYYQGNVTRGIPTYFEINARWYRDSGGTIPLNVTGMGVQLLYNDENGNPQSVRGVGYYQFVFYGDDYGHPMPAEPTISTSSEYTII